MIPRWTPLAVVYLVVAIIGLIGTWTLNILAITQQSTFFGEWFSNGLATQSLQVDLLVLGVASGIFIVIEGRRIGMRRAWVFLPLAAVTAAAFAVPLFLALRERRGGYALTTRVRATRSCGPRRWGSSSTVST